MLATLPVRIAKYFAALCVFLAAASVATFAGPVGVNYTVSGSSGDWTLNFSVTNNVNSGQEVYFFGVLLPAQDILNSPAGSINHTTGVPLTTWNPSLSGDGSISCSNPTYIEYCGGPNITYNNLWNDFKPGGSFGISFGSSLAGFEVGVNSVTAPTSVQWFAYSFDSTEGYNSSTNQIILGSFPYTGGGEFAYGPASECISNGYINCLQEEEENPGFSGTAFVAGAAPTPEPSSLLLLSTGLLGLLAAVGLGPFLRRFAHS